MSTIVVETIKHTNDTTLLASDTSGQLTVKGEGTATTNLQQGLAKTWHISNDAAGQEDSFNIGSGTDNGTGDYTYAFTANQSANSYAHPHTTCIVNCAAWSHTRATSSMRIAVFYDEGGVRNARTHGTVHGDLA